MRSKSRDLLSIDSSAVPIQSSKMRKPMRVCMHRFISLLHTFDISEVVIDFTKYDVHVIRAVIQE